MTHTDVSPYDFYTDLATLVNIQFGCGFDDASDEFNVIYSAVQGHKDILLLHFISHIC